MSELYLNVWDFVSDPRYTFHIFTGGRGIGKTYSALGGCISLGNFHRPDGSQKFVYMRRSQDELEMCMDGVKGEGLNPFKKLNSDYNRDLGIFPIKNKIGGIYNRIKEDDISKPSGLPIGYAVALSTVGKLRGVDFSDCTDVVYDEFITQAHERKIKDEFGALMNAYETINRNREFDGTPPVRMIMLSNAFKVDNPIFIGLGIVADIEKMKAKGRVHKYYPDRRLAVHILPPSEAFAQKKKATALYQLTQGTKFYDMALNNDFAYDDFSNVEYRQLKGYLPFCAMDNAYIYRKKGSQEYYVSYSPCKCPMFTSSILSDVLCFKREFGVALHDPYVYGRIVFESFALKSLILELIL